MSPNKVISDNMNLALPLHHVHLYMYFDLDGICTETPKY